MRIISCPKGGRIPEGYCLKSCLNYLGTPGKENRISFRKMKHVFQSDGRSWLQIYKEDISKDKRAIPCGAL